MKPHCEKCSKPLPMDTSTANICSYECTFCDDCTEQMQHTCPNCGGELTKRPRRMEQQTENN